MKFSIFLVLSLLSFAGFGQAIEGNIHDRNGDPVPFVNVFIQELQTGTTSDANGHYFMLLQPGQYTVVYSSVGYKTQRLEIIIYDNTVKQDIRLALSETELNEIVVKAKRRDPAYEIIQNAVQNKKKYLGQFESYQTEVYIKSSEIKDEKETKKDTKPVEVTLEGYDPGSIFEDNSNHVLKDHHLLEMQLTLYFQQPNHYKEERTAYSLYGSKDGLLVPILSQTDYNFYYNLVYMPGITDVPVISPLAATSVLSYKFKLEESRVENGILVHKIRVTPRKKGSATAEGHIYINEGLWNINRLELQLSNSGLVFHDEFNLSQTYQAINDSTWIPARQEFGYVTKKGKSTSFEGTTSLHYKEFEINPDFPKRFFNNEIASITQEAYERDSTYWNNSRPEPLTVEQLEVINYRDSLKRAHESREYLDSIEANYNKITAIELLVEGFGFRNDEKKRHIYLPSLLSLVNFEVVGGWRFGPYAHYYRRWKSERSLGIFSNASFGIKNSDFTGSLGAHFRYDPFHVGDLSVGFGRGFYSINSFDAYLNQLKINNYILHDYFRIGHRREFFNGFYLTTNLNFSNRKPIDHLDATSILNEFIDETETFELEHHQSLISEVSFSYVPQQRYMREPNRKVILGSKWPTFRVTHKKGWNKIASSDIDFDYLEFGIDQDLLFGVAGNSKYNFKVGKFVNTRNLRFIDLKRFRQSDPYLYSDALNSFQLLDTSLVANDLFIEFHHIHHFNGAFINNIPLIKKTKVRVVAGAGFMWLKENNYRHQEIFAGLERIFKLGVRRRLRIGVYGVTAQSNKTSPATDFKISFDIIDTWKKDWNF